MPSLQPIAPSVTNTVPGTPNWPKMGSSKMIPRLATFLGFTRHLVPVRDGLLGAPGSAQKSDESLLLDHLHLGGGEMYSVHLQKHLFYY